MLFRLFLLLTIVPILELALLFRLARWINWGPTIAVVLVTGALGAVLARNEGVKVLARIRTDLAQGRIPSASMIDGLLVLAAGLVLITPGVLTDVAGLLLLIAPLRRWLRRRLADAFRKHVVVLHPETGGPYAAADDIIDVDVVKGETGAQAGLLSDQDDAPARSEGT